MNKVLAEGVVCFMNGLESPSHLVDGLINRLKLFLKHFEKLCTIIDHEKYSLHIVTFVDRLSLDHELFDDSLSVVVLVNLDRVPDVGLIFAEVANHNVTHILQHIVDKQGGSLLQLKLLLLPQLFLCIHSLEV